MSWECDGDVERVEDLLRQCGDDNLLVYQKGNEGVVFGVWCHVYVYCLFLV